MDPDSEVIGAAEVSAAATADAALAPTLLGDLVLDQGEQATHAVVYGDSAYGTGDHLAWLDQHGFAPMVKTQVPTAPGGRFSKHQFLIDLEAGTITCPARVTVVIIPTRRSGGRAGFGAACSVCPLRQACTSSVRGQVVAVNPREAELAAARWWQARSRAGPGPGGPGLQAAGRGGQPGPVRRPRTALYAQWLAGTARLSGPPATTARRLSTRRTRPSRQKTAPTQGALGTSAQANQTCGSRESAASRPWPLRESRCQIPYSPTPARGRSVGL